MTNTKHILTENIIQIQTSNEFAKMCDINGFKTLGEIVIYPVSELTNKPEFGMRILKELIELLKRYEIEDLLKD